MEAIEALEAKPGLSELVKALSDIADKIERRPRLVGAITNPQTQHETFYSMLFGEVDDLLFRLKELEKAVPNLNQEVMRAAAAALSEELAKSANRIEIAAEAMIQAGNDAKADFLKQVREGTDGVKKFADYAAGLAAQKAKLDVQNEARDLMAAMPEVVADAFKEQLGEVVKTMRIGIQRQAEATRTLRKWGIITAVVLIVVQLGLIGFTVLHTNSPDLSAAPGGNPAAMQKGWR